MDVLTQEVTATVFSRGFELRRQPNVIGWWMFMFKRKSLSSLHFLPKIPGAEPCIRNTVVCPLHSCHAHSLIYSQRVP